LKTTATARITEMRRLTTGIGFEKCVVRRLYYIILKYHNVMGPPPCMLYTVERNVVIRRVLYEGWNFNSGNYLFTTDTK